MISISIYVDMLIPLLLVLLYMEALINVIYM